MSRRQPMAANESARPEDPSRRSVLGGAALPLLPSVAASDHATCACEAWLARHAEHKRLSARWQHLESYLAREYDWLRLNRRQRTRFPEAQEMDDLDDRMEELHDENEALLALLPTIVATTNQGVAAKLAVAAIHICADENEEGHHLIASILRDFCALSGA